MAKQTHIKIDGEWIAVSNVWQQVSGVWKKRAVPFVKISGVWQPCMEYPLFKSLIKYGKLYTWAAATDGTLITGMTIGTDSEWTTLNNYINSNYNVSPNDFGIGNHLKHPRKNGTPVLSSEYNTSTHPRWDSDSTHYGRDTVKFGGLPGGSYTGSFGYIGSNGYWWSSTERSSSIAWFRVMDYSYGGVTRYYLSKGFGFSVRCLRTATSGEQSSYNDGDVIEQVTDYDDNIYDCIRIGTQVWTKQNIAATKYTNGHSISGVYDYNNDSDNTFFATENDSIW